jgi:hypothetical protein
MAPRPSAVFTSSTFAAASPTASSRPLGLSAPTAATGPKERGSAIVAPRAGCQRLARLQSVTSPCGPPVTVASSRAFAVKLMS